MEDGDSLVALRLTRRRARADEWALVLAADGVAALVRGSPDGFVLEVADADRERAERALAAFEEENRSAPPVPEPPVLDRHSPSHALVVGLALLVGFAATGPARSVPELAARGEAHTGRILAGEWWRAITALTLHADLGHALGNAIVGTLFLSAVFRAFGPGVGAALTIAGGMLGNLGNAALRPAEHATIGASTAVFAALGLAAGHTVVRRRAARPFWVPVGAALALLAMLGTEGERVDFWAHALGLAAGLALGVIVACVPATWLARWFVQWAAGLAAAAAIAGAWLRASG